MLSRNMVSLRADLFSFQFFNTINHQLLPIIRQCDGYVDKFFGNAILALFPNLDAATRAGLQILHAVKDFQSAADEKQRTPAYARIGMNAGNVILGTVGDGRRMDGTVIGNTVNVAARMLSLTKLYGARFVTTDKCIHQLQDPTDTNLKNSNPASPKASPKASTPKKHATYQHRVLDIVRVPGKDEPITVHEVFDADSPVARIKVPYEKGFALFQARKLAEAQGYFDEALLAHPMDVPSQLFSERCTRMLREGMPKGWDGVTVVNVK